MTPLTSAQRDALREAAEKATPRKDASIHLDYGYEELEWHRTDGSDPEWSAEDFTFIEATDPSTILSLLDEIEELRKALRELVEAEWMVTHDWGGDRDKVLERARAALSEETKEGER